MLDDELISSKAVDIEVKTLSSWKSGKEGSTVDVLCDSFFQLIVGMRLRTSSETQEGNVKQLLSTLPRTNNAYDSPHGPILACDRGPVGTPTFAVSAPVVNAESNCDW